MCTVSWQVISDLAVRWEVGLNQKRIVYFSYGQEARIMVGDELKMEYDGEMHKPWSGVGTSKLKSLDLGRAPYVLYCVKYIDLVSPAPFQATSSNSPTTKAKRSASDACLYSALWC